MSDNLSNFLVDLASDADRITAFLADPDRILAQSSLTPAEKSAVLSADGAAIRMALGLERGAAAASVLISPESRGSVRQRA